MQKCGFYVFFVHNLVMPWIDEHHNLTLDVWKKTTDNSLQMILQFRYKLICNTGKTVGNHFNHSSAFQYYQEEITLAQIPNQHVLSPECNTCIKSMESFSIIWELPVPSVGEYATKTKQQAHATPGIVLVSRRVISTYQKGRNMQCDTLSRLPDHCVDVNGSDKM